MVEYTRGTDDEGRSRSATADEREDPSDGDPAGAGTGSARGDETAGVSRESLNDEHGENGGNDGDDASRSTDDVPGDRLEAVVERMREYRADDQRRRRETDEGVILDQLDVVEDRLLAFGRALGAAPDDVGDLPFTEEAGRDGMPEPLYVRHDRELLNQVSSWLLQGQHVGLISPYGTGVERIRITPELRERRFGMDR